jgi:hypothetical protein
LEAEEVKKSVMREPPSNVFKILRNFSTGVHVEFQKYNACELAVPFAKYCARAVPDS